MVNSGLDDPIPFTFGTAAYESKDISMFEHTSSNGKRKEKVPRINGEGLDGLKLVLELGIPALMTLAEAVDWADEDWFTKVPKGLFGSAKVKWDGLLADKYTVAKSNRVKA